MGSGLRLDLDVVGDVDHVTAFGFGVNDPVDDFHRHRTADGRTVADIRRDTAHNRVDLRRVNRAQQKVLPGIRAGVVGVDLRTRSQVGAGLALVHANDH